MIETVIVVLFVLWLLGAFVMSPIPAVGGLIHLLLVVILVCVVIRLLQGRSPL